MTELAALYYSAGHYDDVLDLLTQSPDWNARDVSELFGSTPEVDAVSVMWMHIGASPLPVPFMAARALEAKGEKDRAQKINDALLDQDPGLDRGYELLLDLKGTNAIPRLDELFSRDQFEERPLIWKAHLLRQENRLAEAEKVVRQAIAIDPSDGEEGRGDRMRAYAELADILDAQGNAKDAAFYREVVKSIRLSERADQFYLAGLLKRAIGMYQEALTHFSDAYCIQSRLAIQLAALGENDEAAEHYRRAYELMPDSFGRVESHCFGCEKAFDGARAQSIAEKVFTQLAAERPNKPQVHYLLGYLRSEQERYGEALTNYLTAVQLDPDYLNAWVKAREASDQTLVSPRERDRITFNILRLDPLHRHGSLDFERVSDLKGLWQAVTLAASHEPPAATNLFALTVSQRVMDKKKEKMDDSTGGGMGMQQIEIDASAEAMMEWQRNGWGEQNPASAVGQTAFVQVAGQMIINDNNEDSSNNN